MNFNLLTETTKALNVGELHLKLRTFNILDERGIQTIGELIKAINNRFDDINHISPTALADINETLADFAETLTEDGEPDWFKFWEKREISLLPLNFVRGSSPEIILESLTATVKDVLTFEEESDKYGRTVQRRFGLEGLNKLTLDEIGQAYGVTRERIRQIEEKALKALKDALLEKRYSGKSFHVQPEIINFVRALFEAVAREAKGFVSETELMSRVEEVIKVKADKHKDILGLLFNLFGLHPVNIDAYESDQIWEYGKTDQGKVLEQCLKQIDNLLNFEQTEPMDEFDVLVKINARLPKNKKIDSLQLHKFLELCGSIEKRADGLYQGKFEFLKSRSVQFERVLREAGKPLHFEDINREVNNRLVSKGLKKLESRNIANIMSSDERFVAIGKTGLRGLKSWENVELGNIVELMEECLISLNRPATEQEIYDYIREKRPVSDKSISIYLSNQDRFQKAGFKKWGLSTWVETRNAVTWSKQQVADFAAKFFQERNLKETELEFLTAALMQAAGVSETEAKALLKFNPVVKSRRQHSPYKMFAVFNPNYKNELKTYGVKRNRKKETKYQQAEKTVKELLLAAPSSELPLSKIVDELVKINLLDKTAYQYVSKMNFVEKRILSESNITVCRIRQDR